MFREKLPLVSIICTAFNHEKFIRECLDGFIMQKTTFPIEIIVHDDASTDNTQEIIREYEANYPNLFITIYQTENQFSNKDINIWTDIMFPLANLNCNAYSNQRTILPHHFIPSPKIRLV